MSPRWSGGKRVRPKDLRIWADDIASRNAAIIRANMGDDPQKDDAGLHPGFVSDERIAPPALAHDAQRVVATVLVQIA